MQLVLLCLVVTLTRPVVSRTPSAVNSVFLFFSPFFTGFSIEPGVFLTPIPLNRVVFILKVWDKGSYYRTFNCFCSMPCTVISPIVITLMLPFGKRLTSPTCWKYLPRICLQYPLWMCYSHWWHSTSTHQGHTSCFLLHIHQLAVVFQSLSHVRLFVTQWTAAQQASLSFTISQILLKTILWVSDAIWPSHPLSSPYPPAFNLFQHQGLFFSSESALCIKWPSIGASASASIFPMNIWVWFPFRLTGWISLQSKGLSRVFSNTTVQKHQFFGTQLSL